MFTRTTLKSYGGSVVRVRTKAGDGLVRVSAVALLLLAAATTSAQTCPKRCLRGDPGGAAPNDEGKPCAVDSDCNLCNPTHPDYNAEECALAQSKGGLCQARDECIHLEWRPAVIGVTGNGWVVDLGLYAVSSTGFDQPFESVEAILTWDPTKLDFLGRADPCTVSDPCNRECPPDTYKWLSSSFPNDCAEGDGLNAPCPGSPANDGDAFYIALSRLLCGQSDPAPNPMATASGLHITTFRFEVLADVATATAVALVLDVGGNARTRILGGSTGAEIVTGNFPGEAEISVGDCAPPNVHAVGSRVIELDSDSGVGPIGFLVTSGDPRLSCISEYVQANGALGSDSVFLTPDEWGRLVRLRDRRIIPAASYRIQKDCGTVGAPVLSAPVEVTTRRWADTDGSGVIDFDDIARVIAAFVNDYDGLDPPLSRAEVDLVGITDQDPVRSRELFCVPNDVIDFKDIASVVQAFLASTDPHMQPYEILCDVNFCDAK